VFFEKSQPASSQALADAARRTMIEDQLRARGIRDARVLHEMAALRREDFLPADLSASAYDDRALPVDCGQTLSQPYIVALMTERLRLRPQHRVLEIGTGTGYQTAVLSRLVGSVFTVERIDELSRQAAARLARLGCSNVHFHVGDGTLGWPEHAPYDRILVTAGAPETPPALLAQLSTEGILVIPVGPPDEQVLISIERRGAELVRRELLACRFVKLIGSEGWAAT